MGLIQISDLAQYKDVSANIDAIDRFDPYVVDAQRFDIEPVLGKALYLAMVNGLEASPQVARFVTLFDGETYTPKNETYAINFYGLKPALIYYAYARFIENQSISVTRSGVKYKVMPNSEQVEWKTVRQLADSERSKAERYMHDLQKYLHEKQSTYPEYEDRCKDEKISNAPRFFTVNRRKFF